MIQAVGRRSGNKQGISLIAAYEFLEQVTVTITSRGKYGDVIYCRYFDQARTEIGQPFQTRVFPEFAVYCLRRKGTAFVSLSDTSHGDYSYPVPIVDRTKDELEHFFSVCVAPIYGKEPKWLLLAEFIEHYKLQRSKQFPMDLFCHPFFKGATHFYVYIKYIDEYSRILLDDYVRTGEVEVVVLHDRFQRNDDEWQVVELQECLSRAKGHSQWVAFVDLDERLTPTQYHGTLADYLWYVGKLTLPNMIGSLALLHPLFSYSTRSVHHKTMKFWNISDSSIGGIQFRQRWILKNESMPAKYVDKKQIATWMPTVRYHNTSHVGPPGHTAKCIVDPEKVLIMNVHYVDQFTDAYRLHEVDPEDGVVRHYRDVHLGEWGRIWLKEVEEMGNFSYTNYPEKWMHSLRSNVQNRVHYVYGGNR
ncbi:hypothetical protein ANCCAN_02717 [Ancylostoma caninum]|uniref:Glycosyltransferase family 92 protein n=1 Tax=Ancylostoma caninum TaxID=29170 RepID=A0A368H3G6_ANCCA|nr:hypothetical protein ANCCAN_02717 [Ancylostoma caninum]